LSYINTYWLDCEDELNYDSADCIDYEFGKVRWVALIRQKYLASILADPTNPEIWKTGIDEKKIFVMKKVSGSFDPGEPVPLKGYGKRIATRGPREMILTYSDPSFIRNYNFYKRIHTFTDLVPAFRSSSYLQIAESPADIFSRNPIEEDLESIVGWDVQCRWRGTDLPVQVDGTTLLDVFEYFPALRLTAWIQEDDEALIGTEEEGIVFGNE